MIVIMRKGEINDAAAKLLSEQDKGQVHYYSESLDLRKLSKGETLTFIDLTANGSFMRQYEAEDFAEKLVKCGLQSTLTQMNFLISDVPSMNASGDNKSIGPFAQQLTAILDLNHNFHHLKAHNISDFNYEVSILAPPTEKEKNWRVYGIKSFKVEEKFQSSLEFWMKYDPKELLWEGSNIDEWIHDHQRTTVPFARSVAPR